MRSPAVGAVLGDQGQVDSCFKDRDDASPPGTQKTFIAVAPQPPSTGDHAWPTLEHGLSFLLLPTVPASLSLPEQDRGKVVGSSALPRARSPSQASDEKAELLIGHLTRVLSASVIS